MNERIKRRGLIPAVGLLAGGAVAGAVLAGTMSAGAATTPNPAASSSTATADPHPGDNGADGVPESQEHHGAGHGLDLPGTVTGVDVSGSTVTIKTSTGTTTYKVTSSSDIDKSGEAQLPSLAVGDAVTFSVDSGSTIDKLHAGDEAKNMPAAPSSTNGA